METKTQDSKWIQLGKKFAEEQTLKNLRDKNFNWSNLFEKKELESEPLSPPQKKGNEVSEKLKKENN